MLTIPDNILTRFEAVLSKRTVTPAQRADDKKWLRYFLDFCAKYPVPAARSDLVRLFIDKLREKKQTPAHQEQAAYAVSLYFEMQRRPDSENPSVHVNAETTVKAAPPSAPCINQGESSNTISNAEDESLSPISPDATASPRPVTRQRWRMWEEGDAVKSDSPEWGHDRCRACIGD